VQVPARKVLAFFAVFAVVIRCELCDWQNCDQVHIDDISADDNGVDLRSVVTAIYLAIISYTLDNTAVGSRLFIPWPKRPTNNLL